MSVCQPISSGQIHIIKQTSKKDENDICVDVKSADERQQTLRIVANEKVTGSVPEIHSLFDEIEAMNAWKRCKVSINDQEMQSIPYRNGNNQMVFVTDTAPNENLNKIRVECGNDRVAADIVSVGVYDSVLRYGSKIEKIDIAAHQNAKILFTAMTEMKRIEMNLMKRSDSTNRAQRRLLASDDDNLMRAMNDFYSSSPGPMYNQRQRQRGGPGSMQSGQPQFIQRQMSAFKQRSFPPMLEALFDGKSSFKVTKKKFVTLKGPKLPLKVKFENVNDAGNVIAKAVGLDQGSNGYNKEYFDEQSGLSVSSNQDYALSFENGGENEVSIGLESTNVGRVEYDLNTLFNEATNFMKMNEPKIEIIDRKMDQTVDLSQDFMQIEEEIDILNANQSIISVLLFLAIFGGISAFLLNRIKQRISSLRANGQRRQNDDDYQLMEEDEKEEAEKKTAIAI